MKELVASLVAMAFMVLLAGTVAAEPGRAGVIALPDRNGCATVAASVLPPARHCTSAPAIRSAVAPIANPHPADQVYKCGGCFTCTGETGVPNLDHPCRCAHCVPR